MDLVDLVGLLLTFHTPHVRAPGPVLARSHGGDIALGVCVHGFTHQGAIHVDGIVTVTVTRPVCKHRRSWMPHTLSTLQTFTARFYLLMEEFWFFVSVQSVFGCFSCTRRENDILIPISLSLFFFFFNFLVQNISLHIRRSATRSQWRMSIHLSCIRRGQRSCTWVAVYRCVPPETDLTWIAAATLWTFMPSKAMIVPCLYRVWRVLGILYRQK